MDTTSTTTNPTVEVDHDDPLLAWCTAPLWGATRYGVVVERRSSQDFTVLFVTGQVQVVSLQCMAMRESARRRALDIAISTGLANVDYQWVDQAAASGVAFSRTRLAADAAKEHDEVTQGETWQAQAQAAQRALADLWDAIEQEAVARQWCGDYDAFAAEHGGPRRPLTWDVDVEMQVRLGDLGALDDPMSGLLNLDGQRGDVRAALDVTHAANLSLISTNEPDSTEFLDDVQEALRAAGWVFDDFEITSAMRCF